MVNAFFTVSFFPERCGGRVGQVPDEVDAEVMPGTQRPVTPEPKEAENLSIVVLPRKAAGR